MSDLRNMLEESIERDTMESKRDIPDVLVAHHQGRIELATAILYALDTPELYVSNTSAQVRYSRTVPSTGDNELDAMLLCKEAIKELSFDTRRRVTAWLRMIAVSDDMEQR